MAYVVAVTDRTITDVTAPVTAKGYFNVADWTRIYGNAKLTHDLAEIMLGVHISFATSTAPTTATPPTNVITIVKNSLCTNIELMRLAMAALLPNLAAVKYDWVAGVTQDAPTYTDVNLWESTVDAIWNYWSGGSLDVALTLTGNLTILTATSLIVVDSIDAADYDIDIQGTGALYII